MKRPRYCRTSRFAYIVSVTSFTGRYNRLSKNPKSQTRFGFFSDSASSMYSLQQRVWKPALKEAKMQHLEKRNRFSFHLRSFNPETHGFEKQSVQKPSSVRFLAAFYKNGKIHFHFFIITSFRLFCQFLNLIPKISSNWDAIFLPILRQE